MAAEFAQGRGIILADTKFEFGHALDAAGQPTANHCWWTKCSPFQPLLASTRPAPGETNPSTTKQFLRNWLLEQVAAGAWRKGPPGPALPPQVVEATRWRSTAKRSAFWPEQRAA